MEGFCPCCEHRMWTEEVPVASRFRVRACFDDEELSDTYAEPVEWCPGCGTWLKADLLLAARGSRA